MKKFISGLLVGFIIATCGLLYADGTFNTQLAGFKVMVNGQEYNNSEAPALVVNDRTYLPVKGLGDVLGVPVEWNGETKTVDIGKKPEKKIISGKGNTLDTGEFTIKFIKCEWVTAAKVFTVEVTNTSGKTINYDMSNLSMAGYELKLNGSTITSGSINDGSTIKGSLYFRTLDPGNGTYIMKYKDRQTQLNISELAK